MGAWWRDGDSFHAVASGSGAVNPISRILYFFSFHFTLPPFWPEIDHFREMNPHPPTQHSLIRIRLLPKCLAAEVQGRLGDNGAIAVDPRLARQSHLVLVADVGEGRQWV